MVVSSETLGICNSCKIMLGEPPGVKIGEFCGLCEGTSGILQNIYLRIDRKLRKITTREISISILLSKDIENSLRAINIPPYVYKGYWRNRFAKYISRKGFRISETHCLPLLEINLSTWDIKYRFDGLEIGICYNKYGPDYFRGENSLESRIHHTMNRVMGAGEIVINRGVSEGFDTIIPLTPKRIVITYKPYYKSATERRIREFVKLFNIQNGKLYKIQRTFPSIEWTEPTKRISWLEVDGELFTDRLNYNGKNIAISKDQEGYLCEMDMGFPLMEFLNEAGIKVLKKWDLEYIY